MGFISKDHFLFASRQFSSYFKGKSRSIAIDGENWKHLSLGNEDGEPILFLHGMGSNKSLWRSQMVGYCDEKYHRVAIDIPGICMTQHFNRKNHSLQELARWIDQYIDALGFDKVHLTAHSTTTLIATFYAATRPERVASLTMLSVPDLWTSDTLGQGGTVDQFLASIRYANFDDFTRQFNSLFYDPPKLPNSLLRFSYNQQLTHMERFLRVVDEFVSSIPLILAHTKKVTCPILIVNGDSDVYASGKFLNDIHRHFNQANVVRIKKAGHAIMLEKPREILGLHTEFLDRRTITLSHQDKWANLVPSPMAGI